MRWRGQRIFACAKRDVGRCETFGALFLLTSEQSFRSTFRCCKRERSAAVISPSGAFCAIWVVPRKIFAFVSILRRKLFVLRYAQYALSTYRPQICFLDRKNWIITCRTRQKGFINEIRPFISWKKVAGILGEKWDLQDRRLGFFKAQILRAWYVPLSVGSWTARRSPRGIYCHRYSIENEEDAGL